MSVEGKDLAPALEPLISRVRTDATAAKSERGMIWTREALTPVRIKRHLTGGTARGVCPIKAGESTTKVALFDLDSHKGQTSWAEMIRVTDQLCYALEVFNLYPVIFRSSGGRGVHIYLVWDEPQDAYSVRQFLGGVLAELGFKNGAKGVSKGEIEVFPKQDSVAEEGFGNQFILPLAGQSAPLEPLVDFEVMPRDYALQLDWKASDPVPVADRPVREPQALRAFDGGAELAKLVAALDAIDNSGDGLGYDEWREVVSGIHHATGGSDEGYELAYAFSARSDKFEEFELQEKVWNWLNGKTTGGPVITEATVFKMARDAGWEDVAAPEEFPLVPMRKAESVQPNEGHDLDAELPLPNLKRDKHGAIEATVVNLRAVLTRIDVCGMEIAFDEFKDEVVFCQRGAPGRWQKFRDEHYFELRLRLETQGFKPIGRELIRDAVHFVAARRAIDTAMIWLDGLEWDGSPRVERFLERYFSVTDSPYARAVSLYWWTALAGRVLSPGCQADMAPILVSPQQGLRKSSAVAAMAPADTSRVMNFGQSETERSRLLRGALSVELAELHGLKTRAKEEIRAWMTKRWEEWTPKFKEMAVRVPRRCVFVGTSNPTELFEEFERRWLPVMIGSKIDIEGIERDRDQLWAEAACLWAASGVAWQKAEELVAAEQNAFRVVDTWEEALATWAAGEGLDGASPAQVGFTTREAMVECLGFSDKSVKRGDEMRCASALKALGYTQKTAWRTGKTLRVWYPQDFAD